MAMGSVMSNTIVSFNTKPGDFTPTMANIMLMLFTQRAKQLTQVSTATLQKHPSL
jgi:hypothetical protein